MLKEIAIFGAGLIAGALGASYAIGWLEEEEMQKRIEQEEDNSPEIPSEEGQPA